MAEKYAQDPKKAPTHRPALFPKMWVTTSRNAGAFFMLESCPAQSGCLPLRSQKTTTGDVTEWLGRGLQNLLRRFESARHL